MSWTDERVETLRTMWSEGKSASQIAKELGGITRNAVIGKVHRLGCPTGWAGRTVPRTSPARSTRWRGHRAPEPAPAPERRSRRPPPPAARPVGKDPVPAPRPKPGGQPLPPQPSASEISAEALANLAEVAKKARRLSLMQLSERTCKWPIGDPATDDFWFCGLPERAGQALLRDPCGGRLPADVRPPRPPGRRPLARAASPGVDAGGGAC